jgi:signal transduction histidine kinase/ActR/RegA family two-component response regulator
MYNLPADSLREGSTLIEMLELRKAAGTLGDDPAWHAEELARVMSDGKTSTHTRELADGRVISVKARPMHDGAWVVIHEDITEARRIEKERKQIEEQLQRAQRMETVGRLTGGIAHDFNNLLLVMIGNLDLLLDELQHNPNACEKVDTIINASLRGAELTRQLLAFARRQPLQPKNVDAKKLAQRTARLLSRTLGENIDIQVKAPDDLWLAKVDEAQLEAALVNIAINARDAMPNGGTLSIAAANVTMSERIAARIGEIEAGDYIWLEISDTGTGMPPEVLSQIFEPFFTTKETGKGTGLGLSMVYGFVKQSEGHVEARSEVGQGTSIQIFLPRGEPARSTREAGGASATITHGRGELILVVDDNSEARATAMKQLNSLGYRTIEADAAEPALSLIEARNDVDLLFTDVVMPGRMNGAELANMARKLRPNLKVLITSGFPGSLATANDNGAPFASFLPKPYRRAELADAIRRTLKGASAVAADADEEKASARA